MIKTLICSAFLLSSCAWASPQTVPVTAERPTRGIQIIDDDIDRFWGAYDAVRAEPDPSRHRALFERLYIEPGSAGLHAFMEAKGYTVDTYLEAIRRYPNYWDSIRTRTTLAATAVSGLDAHFDRLRQLYPALRPAYVYFEIGALRSGGTTLDDKVLIGAELVSGDAGVDTSDMPEGMRRFLADYWAADPLSSLDLLIVHEAVHTQQRGERQTLLAQAIYEGAADFVAQQATGRLPNLAYVAYGPANDAAIRDAFRRDMAGADFSGWLYNNTSNAFGTRDLGYYVGYAIVSGYHDRAVDKAAALRAIIDLNYADQEAVERFAQESGYFDP